jgi:hypothetical protein
LTRGVEPAVRVEREDARAIERDHKDHHGKRRFPGNTRSSIIIVCIELVDGDRARGQLIISPLSSGASLFSLQPQAYAISRADMQHRARRLFAGLLAQMYERENQYDREIIKHVCAMTEEGPRGAESLPRRKMYEAVPAV